MDLELCYANHIQFANNQLLAFILVDDFVVDTIQSWSGSNVKFMTIEYVITMQSNDISQAPRPIIPPEILPSARLVSRSVWGRVYKKGRGPLHWATGNATQKELRNMALHWRKLATAADIVADWMENPNN